MKKTKELKVSKSYHIYLPKKIRRYLGVKEGDKVEIVPVPTTKYCLIRKVEKDDKNSSD